jgi:uncharacterized protein (DUF1786 family)
MSTYLILDIGAGTMDMLYYDEESDVHYKAVVKSPVKRLAEEIASLRGPILITGKEMGGGEIAAVLRKRVKESQVIMSRSSAATLHHDLERVTSAGIRVVDDLEAEELRKGRAYGGFSIGDIELKRIRSILTGLGVPFSFDVVGICAQDHGVPPKGVSHLDFRHQIFRERLDRDPLPHSLLYRAGKIPSALSRLQAIAESAEALPAQEHYVMDSGMAAILGASMDPRARQRKRKLLVDVATSHTIGAAMDGDEIAGFFEYHTKDITLLRLEQLLRDLADGALEHREILAEGGHGAYICRSYGFKAVEIIVVTGPGRSLMEDSSLSIQLGAPFGDNMMTGTVGVLEAIRRCKDLPPLAYM